MSDFMEVTSDTFEGEVLQADVPVLVDFGAVWCAPCKREFPNLVALHKNYPDDVVCMSMNINYAGLDDETPESARDEVMKFFLRRRLFPERH